MTFHCSKPQSAPPAWPSTHSNHSPAPLTPPSSSPPRPSSPATPWEPENSLSELRRKAKASLPGSLPKARAFKWTSGTSKGPGRSKKPGKNPRPLPTKIKAALRELWLYSDDRAECLRLARYSAALKGFDGFLCAGCQKPHKEVQVDHVVPVGPAPKGRNATGGETWDALIDRLFCPATGLQALCVPCHNRKTHADRRSGERPLLEEK